MTTTGGKYGEENVSMSRSICNELIIDVHVVFGRVSGNQENILPQAL